MNIEETLALYKSYEYTVEYVNEGLNWKAYYKQLNPKIVFGCGNTKEEALQNLNIAKNDWFETWINLGIHIPTPADVNNSNSITTENIELVKEKLRANGIDTGDNKIEQIIADMANDKQFLKFQDKMKVLLNNNAQNKDIIKETLMYTDPLWLLCLKLLDYTPKNYCDTLSRLEIYNNSWMGLPLTKDHIESNIRSILNELNMNDLYESLYYLYLNDPDDKDHAFAEQNSILFSEKNIFGPQMIRSLITDLYVFPEEHLGVLSENVFDIFSRLYYNKGKML